jgi:hypothetical protein
MRNPKSHKKYVLKTTQKPQKPQKKWVGRCVVFGFLFFGALGWPLIPPSGRGEGSSDPRAAARWDLADLPPASPEIIRL